MAKNSVARKGQHRVMRGGVAAIATLALLLAGNGSAAAAPVGVGAEATESQQPRIIVSSDIRIEPERSHWSTAQDVEMTAATPGFVQLSPGYEHAAAVSNGGVLYAWGRNQFGQLGVGQGVTTSSSVPVPVDATGVLQDVSIEKVSVGRDHTVVLSTSGEVYSWGYNRNGQLGDGTKTNRFEPVRVAKGEIPTGVKIVDIATGTHFTVAVGDDGRVYEWGNPYYGDGAGNGDERYTHLTPVLRTDAELTNKVVTQVTAGAYDAMVLTTEGKLYGWGSNKFGELGWKSGIQAQQIEAVPVYTGGALKGRTIVGVDMGISNYSETFTVAWDTEGELFTWGSNRNKQLGTGETAMTFPVPDDVDMTNIGDRKIVDAKAGVGHALALADDGTLFSWGLNKNTYLAAVGGGQLGIGNMVTQPIPVEVNMDDALADQAPFVSINAGAFASFALGTTGKVFSWGASGQWGLLGDGEGMDSYSEVPALGPWFGPLEKIEFGTADGDVTINPDQITSNPGADWTTLSFEAPAYGEPVTGPVGVDVDVTAHFKLLGGQTDSGLTATWPTAAYHYYGDAELSWEGEPTAELTAGTGFVEGATVEFRFNTVASGETGLTEAAFVREGFTGTGTAPTLTCTPQAVAAGQTFSCLGTYRLTAADIQAGRVSLTGKVTAKYDGETLSVQGGAKAASVEGAPQGELVLKKTATSPRAFEVGATASYSFVIDSTGDADVENIEIIETAFEGDLDNLGQITCAMNGQPIEYPIAIMRQGDSAECAAEYLLTQDDVDRGHVRNTALARGTVQPGDDGGFTVDSNSSTAKVQGAPTPSLDFTVFSDFDAEDQSWAQGTAFTYHFQAVNDGPTTVTVTDVTKSAFNGTGTLGGITCTPELDATLAPGAALTCEAAYALTQEDVDNPEDLSLTATAAFTSLGQSLSVEDTHLLDQAPTNEIDLVKAGSAAAGDPWTLDASNTYTFYITNTGDATLSDVVLSDLHGDGGFTGENPLPAPSCTSGDASTTNGVTTIGGTLEPGDTWVCATTYSLTQVDVDSRQVENTATVSASGYAGQLVTDQDRAPIWQGDAGIDLALAKRATAPTPFAAGATVSYTFTVTNNGNGTASNVRVSDEGPRGENGELGYGTWSGVNCAAEGAPASNVIAALAPGASHTCRATYILTGADADAGHITNVAYVQGSDPSGEMDTAMSALVTAGPGAAGQSPVLDLEVTGTNPVNAAVGTAVSFEATVENPGLVTVQNVDLDLPEGFSKTCSPVLPANLAPGSSSTCTVTHSLTQSDLDQQALKLEATAKGTYNSAEVTDTADYTVTWDLRPALALVKTVSDITAEQYRAGAQVTFTFTMENKGNATLFDTRVNEGAFTGVDVDGQPVELAPTCSIPAEGLAPGVVATCTADYTLSQADVDHATELDPGALRNTATATAKTKNGTPVTAAPSTVILGDLGEAGTVSPIASVSLDQQISKIADGKFVAGTEVDFTFTATNNGAVTLDRVNMEYDFGGTGAFAPSCVPALSQPLAPGAGVVCTAKYKLTQKDVDRQSFTSEATATGTYGSQSTAPSSDLDVVTGSNTPKISITKQAAVDGEVIAGAAVEYTFTVKNEGPVSVSAVKIVEQQFTGNGANPVPTCPALPDGGLLAPGSSVTCTAAYTLTQQDLNQGGVANVATATATPVNGTGDFASVNEGSAFVGGNLAASLSLSGTATTDGNSAGSTVTYTWTVTNTGETTVTEIVVGLNGDDFTGTGDLPTMVCDEDALDPDASATCTGTYVLTLEDVNAGAVSASGTATGQVLGAQVSAGPENADVALNPERGLLAVTENTQVPARDFWAGNTIEIPVLVRNIGQTTIENIGAVFTEFDGHGITPETTCDPAALDPGQVAVCDVAYTLTQSDVDNGGFEFKVVAQGGEDVPAIPVGGAVQGQGVFGLDLELTATAVSQADFKAGVDVAFTFTAKNVGKVTVLDLEAEATDFTGHAALGPITCDATSLVPGGAATCLAGYTMTQEDIDQGGVALTGVASGNVAVGSGGPSDAEGAIISGVPINEVAVAKSASRDSGNEGDPYAVGDAVTYKFQVENLGNGTLTGLTLNEDQFGGTGVLGDPTCVVGDASGLAPSDVSLDPGASATCVAPYRLTEGDLGNGRLTNVVTASMKWGASDVEPDSDATVVDLVVEPDLGLEVDATLVGGRFKADATVDIHYTLTNRGPIDLTDWGVAQGFESGQRSGAAQCSQTSAVLTVGSSATCTSAYSLTQEDVDAGALTIRAQGKATGVGGSSSATTEVVTAVVEPSAPISAVSISKTASELDSFSAGAELTYTFAVENTGFTTLSQVNVVEGRFTGSGILQESTCRERDSLAPGDSFTCTADYRLSQDDVDAGAVSNTATATAIESVGNGPIGSEESTALTTVTPLASLSLEKTVADVPDTLAAGETVVFEFVVANTGNVTVRDVEINEDQFGGAADLGTITCSEGDLASIAPQTMVACSAPYVLVEEDVDRGFVENTAVATGATVLGSSVQSDEANATVTLPSRPGASGLTLEKAVDEPARFAAGAELTYSFHVLNTGETTLTDVQVVEGEFSGAGSLSEVTCATVASLEPGQPYDCTAKYVLTQADVDAGRISNVATAIGVGPNGTEVVSPTSRARTETRPLAGLKLTKTAAAVGDFEAGTRINYEFLIENTGDVTISDVALREEEFTGTGSLSEVTCPADALMLAPGDAPVLAPGEKVTCAAVYHLSAEDVAVGRLSNRASSAGTLPDGAHIGANAGTSTQFEIVDPEGGESTAVVKPGGTLAVTGAGVAGLLVAGGVLLGLGLWAWRGSAGSGGPGGPGGPGGRRRGRHAA